MPSSLLVVQPRQHGIGDAADAHLQRGAILDQVGHEFADPRLDRGLRFGVMLDERPVGGDEGVNAIERHHVVAMCARHLRVDLRNDETRGLRGRLGRVAGRAQRTEAVRIRR